MLSELRFILYMVPVGILNKLAAQGLSGPPWAWVFAGHEWL